MKRRDFLTLGGVSAALAALPPRAAEAAPAAPETGAGSPAIAIASGNGLKATARAMEVLRAGGSSLDAAVQGVSEVEADPDDITVGYGGLPNERGVVELDASVMHGPSGRAGAVAALRSVKHPSKVARLVMEQTDHVLLVGEGALEYARAQGFPEENLLTERSRKIWLWWRQTISDKDDWIPPPESEWPAEVKEYVRTYGTVHCAALDPLGGISAATSTSGLFFKMPGRVGDSPIVGAGLYVDNDHGSCGSTGRGEEVLLACGSVSVVEALRRGSSPEEAAFEVLRRIVDRAKRLPRLLKADGSPDFNVNFYVLDRRGRHAGCAIWSGSFYCVHDGRENRRVESAWLYRKKTG